MTATALQRLLSYPHEAVFDTSPQAELALRIRNPTGLVWEVSSTTLRLVTGQNAEWDGVLEFDGRAKFGVMIRDYGLTGKTVGQLAAEIQADGHDVLFENPDLARCGALALVPATGDQDASNGDHLQAHTSLLWSLMGGQAAAVEEAGFQVGQALRQMVLTQAEAEWLDVWAQLYGVPRSDGEIDAALQVRIPQEVFRRRVNGLAIEKAVKDLTGQVITLDEPWRRMFTLDESSLSGSSHMHDGEYFTYHVIQPVGRPGTDWNSVLPVLVRNKAAGVDIYAPRVDLATRYVAAPLLSQFSVLKGQSDWRGLSMPGFNNRVLGVLRLDDEPPIVNHLHAASWLWMLSEPGGFQTEQVIQPRRNISMAAVCLSDGPAFGDENFVLSRGQARTVFDPPPVPSDQMRLSDYVGSVVVERVERITLSVHLGSAASDFVATGVIGQIDARVFVSAEAYPLRGWIGGWDTLQWLPDWRSAGMTRTDTHA